MIRHLLRLVWNRKRSNALLMLEILFSFLVVFAIATAAIFAVAAYRRPLGFEWRNVWQVSIDDQGSTDDSWAAGKGARIQRMLAEARAMPEVEAAAGMGVGPFILGGMRYGWTIEGRGVEADVVETTLDLDKVLGVRVVEGRWFEPADAQRPWRAVVVNRALARAVFGDGDPLGKPLRPTEPGTTELRVVGVIEDFRRTGEIAPPDKVCLQLVREGNPEDRPGSLLLLKLRPGTPPSFEESLVRRLRAIAPEWSYEAKTLEQARATALRERLAPLAIGALIAVFLMSMVGLGLLGVLWQNLVRRTREIGLRRATGASAADVRRQVLFEQLLLATLAMILGLALVLQLPLFGLTALVGPTAFGLGVLVAVISILALTAACSLYPAALAARLEPADALRYE